MSQNKLHVPCCPFHCTLRLKSDYPWNKCRTNCYIIIIIIITILTTWITERKTRHNKRTATYRAQFINFTWPLLHFKSQFSNPVPFFIKSTPLSLEFLLLSFEFLLFLFKLRITYAKGSGLFFNPYCSSAQVCLGLSEQDEILTNRTEPRAR